MKPALRQQRCHRHAAREAVARCPECGRFFCRECIGEHAGRAICAECLETLAAELSAAKQRRRLLPALKNLGGILCGILLAWICFLILGELLTRIPDAFHELDLLD